MDLAVQTEASHCGAACVRAVRWASLRSRSLREQRSVAACVAQRHGARPNRQWPDSKLGCGRAGARVCAAPAVMLAQGRAVSAVARRP